MLTAKQEQFVKNIIDGMSQADAYRHAYPNQRMSDKTIWESASKLLKNPKVSARLQELRDKMVDESIMTAKERLKFLTGVINGTEKEKITQIVDGEPIELEVPISVKNRLSAVDLMNKMQGEYTQKIEAEVNTEVNINIELTDE